MTSMAIRHLLGGVTAVGILLAMPTSNGAPPAAVDVAASIDAHGLPERPRRVVDIEEVAPTGRTIHVTAGGDLQAAIDGANPGDLIALEPGATYQGPFRLPRKDGSGWITISSASRMGTSRVRPSDAPHMAKLVASSGSVIVADPSAHHFRLVGLEIAPAEGVFLRALVQLGASESDV